jgi:UTP--glucose-1-phosphate uridylyltransferase
MSEPVTIRKAIIPVAGYGTRRLPITKAVEKCMLPVGNRPIVDYVVEDCIKAGIEEFYFVVGEEFAQLKRYYGRNLLLEEYLRAKGKTDELGEILALSEKATFHYVVQDQHQPYGTTTPLWLCRAMIGRGESFLFISGDQFYHNPDGTSEVAHFLAEANKLPVEGAMKVVEVPQEEVYKYGIVKCIEKDGYAVLDSIVEKPKVEDAPSRLNNATFFLFSDDIFHYAEKDMIRPHEGEYYITDVVTDYANDGHDVAVIKTKGEYLDGGTTEGWLHANNRVLGNK